MDKIKELRDALERIEKLAQRGAVLPDTDAIRRLYGDIAVMAGVAVARYDRSILNSPDEAAGDGWLPIESAPKDGSPFLFYLPDGRIGIGFVDPREHEGVTFFSRGAAAIGADPYSDMRPGVAMTAEYLNEATHWRPLPAPPAALGVAAPDGGRS